jgi:hypothetical protein
MPTQRVVGCGRGACQGRRPWAWPFVQLERGTWRAAQCNRVDPIFEPAAAQASGPWLACICWLVQRIEWPLVQNRSRIGPSGGPPSHPALEPDPPSCEWRRSWARVCTRLSVARRPLRRWPERAYGTQQSVSAYPAVTVNTRTLPEALEPRGNTDDSPSSDTR